MKAQCPLTFSDVVPELVLAGALLEGFWEFDRTGAEVPEEDAESINVHRVIVLPCQEGRGGNGDAVLFRDGLIRKEWESAEVE